MRISETNQNISQNLCSGEWTPGAAKKGQKRVDQSVDTARMSACATHDQRVWSATLVQVEGEETVAVPDVETRSDHQGHGPGVGAEELRLAEDFEP